MFKREDTVDHVYVILEGLVQGYWNSKKLSGKGEYEERTHDLGPGNYFGDMRKVKIAPRAAKVVGFFPWALMTMDSSVFASILKRHE